MQESKSNINTWQLKEDADAFNTFAEDVFNTKLGETFEAN